MNAKKTFENGILTICLDGKLDASATPQLQQELAADIENAQTLIIDMKDLSYISSAGLRLLLSLHKTMAAKGRMVVKNVNETNLEIFDFTGFSEILNIE